MRFAFSIPAIALGFVLVGCDGSDPLTAPEPDAGSVARPLTRATAADPTPVFVKVTNVGECSLDEHPGYFRELGASGRAKLRFGLLFVVSGTFTGTSCVVIDAKLKGEDAPQDFFNTFAWSVSEVCWPARGLCGVFTTAGPGRITDGIGVDDRAGTIWKGEGGFEGMQMITEPGYECPDSNSDKGCYEGVLLEPGR